MKIEEAIKQKKFRNDVQKAVINLSYTAGWLHARQEEFFKPFGITVVQFNILRILRGQSGNPISGQEIKSRMLERNSDISRLLDRLEAKSLIERKPCPEDRRAMNIAIAKGGLAVLSRIDSQIDKSEKLILQLSRKEAKQLSDLLDKARG